MKKLGIAHGDKVLIQKAGEIIPQVVRVVEAGGNNTIIPDTCPVCGWPTSSDKANLWCINPFCDARLEERVLHYLKTMDVLGVGPALIHAVCENGMVKTLPDLYNMNIHELESITGGIGSATNIRQAIFSKNEIPLWQFLASLGVPSLGRTASKAVAKHWRSIERVVEKVSTTPYKAVLELTSIEGIGESTATSIVNGLNGIISEVHALSSMLDVQGVKESSGPLSGMSFCLTGSMSRPRKSLEADIEAAGGEARSSVSKGLTALVQSDKTSQSSKSKKALSIGARVISEEELTKMMEGGGC